MAWITTYTGKAFPLLEPDRAAIDIDDIAHALSMVCRFNGHSKSFYSVAEHSVYVSILSPKGMKLSGLLHDASEAYIGDVVSPLKHSLKEYQDVEEKLMTVLAEKFEFSWPLPTKIHEIDKAQLHTEARLLLNDASWVPHWEPGQLRGMKPYCLSPEKAEELFKTWFKTYIINGEH